MRTVAMLAVVVSLAACGGSQSVPVRGSDEDISAIAGNWEGSYKGIDSGREGSVKFDLTPGYHAAEGQVIMHPTGGTAEAQPLSIKFVSISKGKIGGKIDPYTDPGCKCQVETDFVGAVVGDSMEGTFVTHGTNPPLEMKGTWQAVRKSK